MKRVKVHIITIGDEILIGQIVDTNSAWMGIELNKAGFEIQGISSVHDNADQIVYALDEALKQVDVVLFTGGIGPTKDDITKQTLSAYFGSELVFDQSVLDNIVQLFANRPHAVINELTYAQAYVPDKCIVLQNRVGTAPVTWFEKQGQVIVSMPGVPYEMKVAMAEQVIPRLKQHYETPSIVHKNILVYGIGESALAMKIAGWEDMLPDNVSLAYLPHYGIVKLRLSGVSDDVLSLEFAMNQQVERLAEILEEAIVSYDDLSEGQLVGLMLKKEKLTIASAESCTGGYIAHQITAVAGCSDYYKGSVVAYSNDVKERVLGVNPVDLEENGAVSRVVVEQMAEGVRRLLQTDIGIATSGVAGPDGGTEQKPVGTVWVAVSLKNRTISREYRFGTMREQNIQRAAQAALMMVRELFW